MIWHYQTFWTLWNQIYGWKYPKLSWGDGSIAYGFKNLP